METNQKWHGYERKSNLVEPITDEGIIGILFGSPKGKIQFDLANLKKEKAILGMP